MGNGYHLAMPTRSTDQILLKLQLRQSSDKVKTTQAGNQIKDQVTQPPIPFPQITRRTGHQTTSKTQRTREISPENLTLGDDHAYKITSRIQQTRLTRLETHLKALIKQLRNRKQIGAQRLHKSNPLQRYLVTHMHYTLKNHPSSSAVSKRDVHLFLHWGEAGEPLLLSGHVSGTAGVDQPNVLQASCLQSETITRMSQQLDTNVSTKKVEPVSSHLL
jgi:hypothetical protein